MVVKPMGSFDPVRQLADSALDNNPGRAASYNINPMRSMIILTPELQPVHERERVLQLDIFTARDSELHKELHNLDIDNMTPLAALQKLHEMKDKTK